MRRLIQLKGLRLLDLLKNKTVEKLSAGPFTEVPCFLCAEYACLLLGAGLESLSNLMVSIVFQYRTEESRTVSYCRKDLDLTHGRYCSGMSTLWWSNWERIPVESASGLFLPGKFGGSRCRI